MTCHGRGCVQCDEVLLTTGHRNMVVYETVTNHVHLLLLADHTLHWTTSGMCCALVPVQDATGDPPTVRKRCCSNRARSLASSKVLHMHTLFPRGFMTTRASGSGVAPGMETVLGADPATELTPPQNPPVHRLLSPRLHSLPLPPPPRRLPPPQTPASLHHLKKKTRLAPRP